MSTNLALAVRIQLHDGGRQSAGGGVLVPVVTWAQVARQRALLRHPLLLLAAHWRNRKFKLLSVKET